MGQRRQNPREVLKLLVDRGLLSPEWAERILSWRHKGFNVVVAVPGANLKPSSKREFLS